MQTNLLNASMSGSGVAWVKVERVRTESDGDNRRAKTESDEFARV